MKIAIIGKNSYIGQHCIQWLAEKEPDWEIAAVGAQNKEYKYYDFTGMDVIIHLAGLVHRRDIEDWNLYKQINVDLPVEVAQKAKKQKVKQFVFFSTMGVYGIGKKLAPNIIDEKTTPMPTSYYGKSKYLAEQELKKLEDNSFHLTVVRPPNVYGKNCRGGYITGFESVVRKVPLIPAAYENVKQSMIYIDNLCELVHVVIKENMRGIFCPQDDTAVSAVDLMNGISDGLSLHRRCSKALGALVHLVSFLPIVTKAYGGIEYDKKISHFEGINYQIVSFNEGIRATVEI